MVVVRSAPWPFRSRSLPSSPGRRAVVALLAGVAVSGVLLPIPVPAQTVDTDYWVADNEVHALVRSGAIIYVGGAFTRFGPATGGGVLVEEFTGARVQPFPKVAGTVNAAVPDGAGGWYIGGTISAVNGWPRSNLAHILADGTLSPWNPQVDRQVSALAVSGDTVYAGGVFLNVGGQPRRCLAAVDAVTGAVTSWNPAAPPNVSNIAALEVSGSTVYVGGSFTEMGGQLRNHLAALDATTGAATSWNPGLSATGSVSDILVDGTTIYVAGFFTLAGGGTTRTHIAAIDATTGVPTSWNPAANANVTSLAKNGGTIYAGGSFTQIGGQPRNRIAALDAGTGLATSWNPNANGGVNILTTNGGAVFAGGSFTAMNGTPRRFLAAIDPGTGSCTSWNPDPNSYVYALVIGGGTVFLGGNLSSIGGVTRNHIAALDAATGQPTPWNPNADNTVFALAANETTVYAGGDFNSIGGLNREKLAALSVSTGAARSFHPFPDNRVNALALSGNTLYVGGDFYSVANGSFHHFGALDATTGYQAPGWVNEANGAVYALALDGGTLYVGGRFNAVGGASRSLVAAVDATTGAATPWDPEVTGDQVNALAVMDTTVYVGGDYWDIGGSGLGYLAAVGAPSGGVTSWDPQALGAIYCLAPAGNLLYVGGSFLELGGIDRYGLAALDVGTALALPWDPEFSPEFGYANAMLVDGGSLLIGGFFQSVKRQPQAFVARLTGGTVGVRDEPPPRGFTLAPILPNPARGSARIRFTLDAGGRVSLHVHDVQGRRVATLLDRAFEREGSHEVEMSTRGLAKGLYFLRLTAGGRSRAATMLVLD